MKNDATTQATEPSSTTADDNTVTLECPIQRGATAIHSITLRKPKAGELRGLAMTDIIKMEVSALETLIPRIAQPLVTKADVANMDPADLLNCGTMVVGFLLTKAEKANAYPTA